MNLLATYIAAKGLERLSKESGYSSRSSSSFDSSIVNPSKESIQKVLEEQGENIALANYIKNLHTSMWDHCDRHRRETSDNKTQRIVLKHCRKNGMTREQENAVEKLAKEHMDKVKPWKRMDARGGNTYKLTEGFKMIVVPNDFTLQQRQYLCACMKEYGMDTLVIANENGKEACIMSFNSIDVRRMMTPDLFKHSFSQSYAIISVSEQDKNFCRAYSSSRRYLETNIRIENGSHMNLDALRIVLDSMHKDGFSNSYCQLPYGMKLVEPDAPEIKQEDKNTAFMSGGDDILNGDENLSVPENSDNINRDDIDK